MTGQRPTITELARELELGVGTVSNALNGKGRVAARTRDRVLAYARQRGYRPNAAARNLRAGGLGAIELHLPKKAKHLSFYMDFAFGVLDAASEAGRDVLLTTGEQTRPEGSTGIDGAVFIDCESGSERLSELVETGLPVVVGDGVPAGSPHPTAEVNVDYSNSVHQIISTAVAAGAHRPMLVAPDDTLDSSWRHILHSAFNDACASEDITGGIVDFPVDAPDSMLIARLKQVLSGGSPEHSEAPDLIVFGGQRLAGIACTSLDLGRPGSQVPWIASLAADTVNEVDSPLIAALDIRPRAFGTRCGEVLLQLLKEPDLSTVPDKQRQRTENTDPAHHCESWPTRITWPAHWRSA